jgi:hypothetical protein
MKTDNVLAVFLGCLIISAAIGCMTRAAWGCVGVGASFIITACVDTYVKEK